MAIAKPVVVPGEIYFDVFILYPGFYPGEIYFDVFDLNPGLYPGLIYFALAGLIDFNNLKPSFISFSIIQILTIFAKDEKNCSTTYLRMQAQLL